MHLVECRGCRYVLLDAADSLKLPGVDQECCVADQRVAMNRQLVEIVKVQEINEDLLHGAERPL